MKLGRRKELILPQAKIYLHNKGIKIKPSYHHEDYVCTSLAMPYDLKDKLDALCKKYNITRSGFIQLLVRNFEG
jgi:hypothetical protein